MDGTPFWSPSGFQTSLFILPKTERGIKPLLSRYGLQLNGIARARCHAEPATDASVTVNLGNTLFGQRNSVNLASIDAISA